MHSRRQEHLVACEWLLDTFGTEASAADVANTWALMRLLTVQGFNWTGFFSHWRDCHFADALSPSLLKPLLKVEGGAAE